MKLVLYMCCMLLLQISCVPKAQIKYVSYKNIIILSDMSSRIKNKKPKDIKEIYKLIEFFRNECVKPGEKIGDNSAITFSSFSEKQIVSIDIEKIKNLLEKQQFINSVGNYAN